MFLVIVCFESIQVRFRISSRYCQFNACVNAMLLPITFHGSPITPYIVHESERCVLKLQLKVGFEGNRYEGACMRHASMLKTYQTEYLHMLLEKYTKHIQFIKRKSKRHFWWKKAWHILILNIFSDFLAKLAFYSDSCQFRVGSLKTRPCNSPTATILLSQVLSVHWPDYSNVWVITAKATDLKVLATLETE